ncbi:ArsR/SmtB family transcription factor [Actinomadura oligospora]|uniref:ArsR/SmtB family transcription factor n=1 Tax=Actinomadura oligospora TaxID=111804 RepID=UPI00047D9C4B|nr:metalloregulator ArsR/SmtB family transcription factor [Actinomadura oligospora]
MRSMAQPPTTDLELVAVLRALADPVRLELVRRLAAGGEVSCSPDDLDVPRSTLSNHWRVLREAGLTHTRAEGKARYMTLRHNDLQTRFPGLLETILTSATPPS